MHIWTDIVIRELAMLAILFALGSGPAAYLGGRFGPAARLALAPILGLCVGTCVFTTLIWFTAARHTYWLVPVLAAMSLAAALRRCLIAARAEGEAEGATRYLRFLRRLHAGDALALLAVCVIVAAPLDYTLHERHSLGPLGYAVWDSVDYTAEPDGMEQQSIREASGHYSEAEIHGFVNGGKNPSHAVNKRSNFVRLFWSFYASGDQNLDAAPLSANVNAFLGIGATGTQGLFLIAFLIAGALGAFAAIRYAMDRPRWIAPLGGVLFAGPFFMQLIADGSQAAVCGLGLVLPLIALGVDTLRERSFAAIALLALIGSGLLAVYPLFAPTVVLASGAILLALAAHAWYRGRLKWRAVLLTLAGAAAVIALAAIFDLVAFTRDVRYWHDVLKGAYFSAGLPEYHLPIAVLPGWLLQTREFYGLTDLGYTSSHEMLIGIAIPFVLVVTMLAGLLRRRALFVLVPFVLVCAAFAAYVSLAQDCSYCTDRNLLPLAPLGIALLVLGIGTLALARSGWMRLAAVAVAALALVSVASRTRQERLRFANGAYFLDGANRALLAHLPPHADTVDVEGYGQNPGKATGELPLVYYLVSEVNGGRVSLPSEFVDFLGLAYLGEANKANPQFSPYYRYVLTRFGGVANGRRVIARTGSLALEERSGSLDVTLVSGVVVPPVRRDPDGRPWLHGPLQMLLVGESPGPAWVALRFATHVPVTVPPQPGVVTRLRRGVLSACVRATGSPPTRKAAIALGFQPVPGSVPNEPFAVPDPPQGVQLLEMRAVTHCSP
jgi:MFS family permease